ncbi:MAG: pyruvate dehydrogenase (acetyl-transferring) E1 component subunit alpha [Phycisphaeraceae bacterium]
MATATQDKARARPSDNLDGPRLLQLLHDMMLIRRFEERTMQSYMQQKIGGFCHIYIGQEAVAVGSIAAARDGDPVITAYRDHGHALARGMHPNYAMAELYGKLAGCAKGKGGSMHFFDKPRHLYGGHAIVGGQCPLGVGLAFALQYNREDKVCLCYLGDGALNQGAFHESMNLAAIWRLPIIFAVENNYYSMGTHIARGTAMAEDLSKKADAYGMRYAECDGLDLMEVYDTFHTEIEKTRGSYTKVLGHDEDAGEGPCFINVKTYRYQGHSMSDPQKYRAKDEVKEIQQRDCINLLVNHLIEKELTSQEQIDELDQQTKQRAIDSVKYAENAPEPGNEELYTDVFSEPFPPFEKGELPALIRDENSGE